MDSDNVVCGDGSEVSHQNGIQEEDHLISNGLNGAVGISMESSVPDGSSGEVEEESHAHVQSSDLAFPGELAKDGNQPRQSKPQKSKVKVKTEKASHPKNVSAEGMKKNKDVQEIGASTTVPNGHDVPIACPKQPVKTRPVSNSHAHAPKQSAKPATAPSEDLVEKTTLKPLKKGPHAKAEGETQSSSSPTSGDIKARKAGALPSYGFSFKCSERAEKRREFYTKLEEMTQAKEEEKNTLQAKTKESQQAEIKMLRKSLNFKATPMPSFYQEPPPPKVELKKIPITRAKSPKLGRKKNAGIGGDVDGSRDSSLLVRLSLDERVSQNNSAAGVSPIHSKQPSRNSLPGKLPSAKKAPSKTTTNDQKKPSLKASHVEKSTSLKASNEENTADSFKSEDAVPSTNPSKTHDRNDEPVVEEQAQLNQLPPEPAIAVAHLGT